jgi:threonine synthase
MTAPISPTLLNDRFTKEIGVPVYIKPEITSATGSYKDRMAAAAIEEAQAANASRVVLTSSGNQGVAIAYAAQKAGLPCVVVSTKHILPIYREELQRLGAELELTPDMKSRSDRFHERVAEGWFPLSVVPEDRGNKIQAGKSGYAAIAREIVEALGKAPEFLILPSCFGDGCSGILKGFQALQEERGTLIPKFILLRAKSDVDIAFSITANITTPEVASVEETTGGRSIFYQHEDFVAAEKLAKEEGFDVEPCSAIPLLAVQQLHAAEPDLFKDSTIVLLMTARSRPGTTPE